MSAFFI